VSVHLILCEGVRGAGKSETTGRLRQILPSSTLINFTGFKEDGSIGKDKVYGYYDAFLTLFETLSKEDHSYTFICDRIFLSEIVFSKLYKNYTFEGYNLLKRLLSNNIHIDIFHLMVNSKEIPNRLNREKKDHFASIAESVVEIERQKSEYDNVFKWLNEFKKLYGWTNLRIYDIDTSFITSSEVVDSIKSYLAGDTPEFNQRSYYNKTGGFKGGD
jgi:thymidylate kinase